jgi:hypothetical protein
VPQCFEPGHRHPTLGQGETLAWSGHGDNGVLERWALREQGVALSGPDPQDLIAPIPAQVLCAAVSTRLCDWSCREGTRRDDTVNLTVVLEARRVVRCVGGAALVRGGLL